MMSKEKKKALKKQKNQRLKKMKSFEWNRRKEHPFSQKKFEKYFTNARLKGSSRKYMKLSAIIFGER